MARLQLKSAHLAYTATNHLSICQCNTPTCSINLTYSAGTIHANWTANCQETSLSSVTVNGVAQSVSGCTDSGTVNYSMGASAPDRICVSVTNDCLETAECCVDVPCCPRMTDQVYEVQGLSSLYEIDCDIVPSGGGAVIRTFYGKVSGLDALNGTWYSSLDTSRASAACTLADPSSLKTQTLTSGTIQNKVTYGTGVGTDEDQVMTGNWYLKYPGGNVVEIWFECSSYTINGVSQTCPADFNITRSTGSTGTDSDCTEAIVCDTVTNWCTRGVTDGDQMNIFPDGTNCLTIGSGEQRSCRTNPYPSLNDSPAVCYYGDYESRGGFYVAL